MACTGKSTKLQVPPETNILGFKLYRRAYENRPLKWGKRLRRDSPLGQIPQGL
jgi:hypothetical protein